MLFIDPAGNLYGTAFESGPGSGGTVFELTPVGLGCLIPPGMPDGAWSYEVIYNFGRGHGSKSVGLSLGKDGVLYGTTPAGWKPGVR